MPDGDVFQRRLRGTGRGWQAIVRLLNSHPDRLDLDQKISQAFAKNLRELPPAFIRNVVGVLLDAVSSERRHLSLGTNTDTFLDFCYALRLENGGNAFEIATIAKESAQAFFLANRERCRMLTEQNIVEGFADRLAEKLIDSRFNRNHDVLLVNTGPDVG